MRNRTRFGAITSCALLLFIGTAAAQTDIGWVGPAGGGWGIAQNWNPQTVPHNVGTITYTATVNANGPVVDGGFTILGLNLNDQILLGSSSNLGFGVGMPTGNTFINGNGSINIAPGAMTAPTSLVLQGGTTLTLSGNGSILMGGLGTARIVGGPTSTFNNTNWRIVGEGNLLEGFVRLVNNGTITASGGSLVLNAAGYTNDRLMSATAGSVLRINGSFGTMTNNGSILADGGIVNLAQGLHIDGGTLTTTNGGLIATAPGGVNTVRLSGVTNAGSYLSLGGTNTDIDTMFTNRGTFTIETGGHLRVIGAATLAGTGTVVMQPLSEIVRSGTGSATLVNLTNTIRGNGQIAGIELVNELDGKILVDGGASLLIQHSSRGMRNAGLIRVGSPDDLTHGTLVFSGFNGGSFNNTEATIQLYTGGSRLRLIDGAVIAGGQITSFGFGESQVIVPAGHVAALNRVNVFGTRVDVQGILRVAHQIDGSGVFDIRAGAAVHVDGSATFGFGHNWSMNTSAMFRSAPGSGDDAEGATAELFNDGVIAGAGSLGVNTLRITNNGTITANAGTAQVPLLLAVDPSPEGLLNAGVMESDDFGVMLLSGAGGGSFTQQGTAILRALGPSSNVRLGGTTFSLSGGMLGSGAGSIAVDGGTTATLADLTSDARLTTGLGQATIVINSNVVNNGTVSLPAGGRLLVAGASTLNSASGHIASNGSITVNTNGNLDANFIAGTGSVLVQPGGTLRAHSIRQSILNIQAGGFVHLKSAFTGSVDPSRVGSLSLGAAPAFLDVANRVLIIDQSGTIALNTLRNQIIAGHNGGTWDGPGIRSSSAAADPGHGIGYGEASAIFTSFPATYFGETIDNTTLLVTYTRYGDANLDRQVNLQDFNRLAANFGQSGKLWTDGDSTYDGTVNLEDFNRMAANFGLSAAGPEVTPADWAALASAVPEPGALPPLLVALALTTHCSRRSRRGGPSCDREHGLPLRPRACC